MEHVALRHTRCDSNPGMCPICDGGLFVCKICGAAEGEVPTDCPGEKLGPATLESIFKGDLDYKNGTWINLK